MGMLSLEPFSLQNKGRGGQTSSLKRGRLKDKRNIEIIEKENLY